MDRQQSTVLHLTAHLGGGVGKALSGLVEASRLEHTDLRHHIVCLEKPEKSLFVDQVVASGCPVTVAPDSCELQRLVAEADIVQLEWWNHPATIAALCRCELPPMRLLVWSHISGLYTPVIPEGLLSAAERFLFTSPCSYQAEAVVRLLPAISERLGVVNSCGGFQGFPEPGTMRKDPVRAGYLGSLNFAKLHPQYVDFLKAVDLSDFRVRLIGDTLNREILERQCELAGKSGLLEFHGYTKDVVSALGSVNTLVYLLNPEHYGTTENALLEAMAMGIVPVVLDNPAERNIVEDGNTGMVVRSPAELADAIRWLSEHPQARHEMGVRAAASVRERFAVSKMATALHGHYRSVMASEKKTTVFSDIFGPTAAEWFLCCQGNSAIFTEATTAISAFSRHGLKERTKGSVFHFQQYFPDNERLQQWAAQIEALP
jgi:L-malate glycosyltransferase